MKRIKIRKNGTLTSPIYWEDRIYGFYDSNQKAIAVLIHFEAEAETNVYQDQERFRFIYIPTGEHPSPNTNPEEAVKSAIREGHKVYELGKGLPFLKKLFIKRLFL